MSPEDSIVRSQLVSFLKGGAAHVDLSAALADFPVARAGERPEALPYSAWQILEHMRITVNDLLQFATNSGYRELAWPDEYWPKDAEPPSSSAWEQSARALEADIAEFAALVQNENSNLTASIPWGKNNENLLREVLLAADHTSYHVGEFIVLRRLLGEWKR